LLIIFSIIEENEVTVKHAPRLPIILTNDVKTPKSQVLPHPSCGLIQARKAG
jgi:hypothetical protein